MKKFNETYLYKKMPDYEKSIQEMINLMNHFLI